MDWADVHRLGDIIGGVRPRLAAVSRQSRIGRALWPALAGGGRRPRGVGPAAPSVPGGHRRRGDRRRAPDAVGAGDRGGRAERGGRAAGRGVAAADRAAGDREAARGRRGGRGVGLPRRLDGATTPRPRPSDLLVVSSATVADLARGRAQALFGSRRRRRARRRGAAARARSRWRCWRRTALRAGGAAEVEAALGRAAGRRPARPAARAPVRGRGRRVDEDAARAAGAARRASRATCPTARTRAAARRRWGWSPATPTWCWRRERRCAAEVAAGRLRALRWPRARRRRAARLDGGPGGPGPAPGQHARMQDELARLGARSRTGARALRAQGRDVAARRAVPRDFLAAAAGRGDLAAARHRAPVDRLSVHDAGRVPPSGLKRAGSREHSENSRCGRTAASSLASQVARRTRPEG